MVNGAGGAGGFRTLLILMVQGVLQVPIEGSIPLFMLGVALSLFATTSIGIFMGTVARSMPQLGLLMILVLLPLQMLSGGSTPRESMPQAVQDIMLTMPTTHFVSLAQAILYRGADFSIVWPQFLTLLAIGGVFLLSPYCVFVRRSGKWPEAIPMSLCRSQHRRYLWRFIKRRRAQVNPIAMLNRINSSSTQLTEILSSALSVISG